MNLHNQQSWSCTFTLTRLIQCIFIVLVYPPTFYRHSMVDAIYSATLNRWITKIAGSGSIQGLSGTGGKASSALLNTTSRIALDTSANTYYLLADSGNHAIRKVSYATGFITTVAGTLGSVE